MKVAVLFAGGKDSTFAAYKMLKNGLEVEYLLTIISKNPHSWMFHTVNIDITRYQAEAMGIEQLIRYTSGEKERELRDLKGIVGAVRNRVDGIVIGATASSYQKNRIDRVCEELGLTPIAPLWGRDPIKLLHEMVNTGFEIIVTGVAAQGFDQSWLGRKIDEKTIDDLLELNRRYRIDLCGEGGEYETLVLDAPFFHKRVEVLKAKRIWERTWGRFFVEKAKLVQKR